ncbi:hypothetical protein GLOIN_2v1784886 [Rhizophagus clarus]|nr:hypothetical protein GLOIN_2v1784886 [Rhizophagus clarus]
MSNFTKLIYKLLFLIFIENEVNLHNFEVTLLNHNELEYFDEILELILQNPNFIRNIKDFKLDFDEVTDNISKLLGFLNYNCKSISSFYFLFPSYNNNYPMIEKSLSQIINSQENLQKILLGFNGYYPLRHLLLSLRHPNCSNTLNTIIFYYTNFTNIVVLGEVINQLNVLESIHIIYCYSLDSKFIQQINNITKPFKLKSLFIHEKLRIESLKSLIQKSANYLENFAITNSDIQQLYQLVIKYCRKIKYIGPIWFDKQSIHLLFNLIENITQNLNYLTIDAFNADYYYSSEDFSSIILQDLGQVLPLKLEYLNLILTVNLSNFAVFLENSQTTFIKKLLISNIKKEVVEDIFPYIYEYIVKKKRVKHLAILETFYGKSDDLFSQKDKVEECQLHGIQVSNYNDLIINIYDFIKETY